MKYYPQIEDDFRHETMYECLFRNNAGNMDSYALSYFGNKITYREMKKRIDSIAHGFRENGIISGERVIVLGLNNPEILYAIYALNKLGAIVCNEYITLAEDKLADIIKSYNAKYVVIIDSVYDKYVHVFEETNVEKVFLARTYTSMPMPLRFLAKGKFKIKNTQNARIEISDMIKKYLSVTDNAYVGNGNSIAVVISTSGTTGIPKRAELTNDAINSLAYQGRYVDVGMELGATMLTPAPPFLAFGISLTTHMPLCNGVCLILSISPDPDFVIKQFIKYKPNLFAGGHVFCDKMMNSLKINKMDLSFLKMIELGGEKIEAEYKEKLDTFFRLRGYCGHIFSGYGMTETAACSTTEMKNVKKGDSVGIPLCMVNMKIVDTETGEELKYGEEGEIMINSPCAMEGYYNNKEATDEIFEFADNVKWVHTGDIGRIDEEGYIYVVGRIKRIATTIDPISNAQVKLYPDYIEHILNGCEYVYQCAVITVEHSTRKNIPIVFVKLVNDDSEKLHLIQEYIEKNMEEYNHPEKYVVLEKIPLRPNGKTDYKELEKMI